MCLSANSFSYSRAYWSKIDYCCKRRSFSRAVDVVELVRDDERGFSSITIYDPDRYKNSIEGRITCTSLKCPPGDIPTGEIVLLGSAPFLSCES